MKGLLGFGGIDGGGDLNSTGGAEMGAAGFGVVCGGRGGPLTGLATSGEELVVGVTRESSGDRAKLREGDADRGECKSGCAIWPSSALHRRW